MRELIAALGVVASVILLTLLLMGGIKAFAQQQQRVTPSGPSGIALDASISLGTTTTQVLPAVGQRTWLYIQNLSATAQVSCTFTSAAVAGTAGMIVLNAGGTGLAGGSLYMGNGGFVSNEAVNCISSAAATPLTVKTY